VNKRKYNITKITLGAILFTISVALITDFYFENFVVYKNDYANTGKIKRLIENDNKSEIAIFGSSIARNNYFADSLDFPTFNYGMKGMVFEYLEPLMQIELEKDKDAPIIFDFHHLAFLAHESIPLQLSNFVPFVENERIANILEKRKLNKAYLKVKGLRYFGCYTDYLKEYMRSSFNTSITIGKGGVHSPSQSEVIFQRFITKRQQSILTRDELKIKSEKTPNLFTITDSLELNRLNSLLRFTPSNSEVERFEKMIEDNQHRLFILVYSPQHYTKLDGIDNYDEMIWFLEKLKDRHENLKILNYSYESYPNEYFRDTGHLSLKGAQHFSGLLNKDLTKLLESGD